MCPDNTQCVVIVMWKQPFYVFVVKQGHAHSAALRLGLGVRVEIPDQASEDLHDFASLFL